MTLRERELIFRVSHNLSQMEMAMLCGFGRDVIINLEAGRGISKQSEGKILLAMQQSEKGKTQNETE